MTVSGLPLFLILGVFIVGYVAIIFEYYIKVNKTASALAVAVLCWGVYFVSAPDFDRVFAHLGSYLAEISQIVFFLMGAMTLVEIIDSHKGFRLVTDLIRTSSKRKMLWLTCIAAFFLSAVLDNLTTTILMVSLLRKLIGDPKERFLPSCMIVVAANAGGAWTPIGDVTTTMLWIHGRLSTLAVVKALFIPSVIALLVPLLFFARRLKGTYQSEKTEKDEREPGARRIFYLGVAALIFVPILKGQIGLPPFMGMMIGLAVLWLVTDLVHHSFDYRNHLRVPHILTKIDISAVLFFLGILLSVSVLDSVGILEWSADWLNRELGDLRLITTSIGIFSAIIDNVPLVAGTIGMYSLNEFPVDAPLWHMIAYAAGTGGSILLIGSSSGIALMGMEKIHFVDYMKKLSIPVLVGYLIGMGAYLLLH